MCDAGSGAGRLCFLSLWHNLGVFLFFFAYELGVFWWGALVTYFFFFLVFSLLYITKSRYVRLCRVVCVHMVTDE